jgi:hypothetical protein
VLLFKTKEAFQKAFSYQNPTPENPLKGIKTVMNCKFLFLINLLSVLCTVVVAQGPFFEVTFIEGSAKVQRHQKREWDPITTGTKIYDNDLVETQFQTKLLLRFGDNNLIIVGSNSKLLFNIVPQRDERGIITNVNLTLFAGGVFAKAISNCHLSFYSANAVGEMDSGAVSTVTDNKNGETGFQVLGGLVQVRNIAQSKSIPLRSGLTTMILPNREPTAPLYLTHRHIAVLKHYFGEDYITNELNASGIEPTEESSASRLALSQNLSAAFFDSSDHGMHKSTFSPDKVYGSLMRDQTFFLFYKPIIRPQKITSNKGFLKLYSSLGIFSGGVKGGFSLSPSIHLPALNAALDFTISQNSSSRMNPGFSSASGILNKIQHFQLGKLSDSTFIHLGKIENYSLGYGLIVDNFSNQDPNRIFNSPGISSQINIADALNFKAFLGNLTNPYYGGFYISIFPSVYTFGLGYYFDSNLYKEKSSPDDFRYEIMEKAENSATDQHLKPSNSHIYELDLETEIISSYDLKMSMLFEFAQKIQNGNDGIVARIPTILWDIENMRFAASLVIETKRLLSSHFSPFYLSNRYRVKKDQSGLSDDTVYSQNNYLSRNRQSSGFALTFKANPTKGLDLDIYYKQDFISKNTVNLYNANQDTDSSLKVTGDFTLLLKCKINDTLVPFFKYGEIYYQQYHGRLFPADSKFFLSWGMQSGFNLITRPLFKSMAFEAGGRLLYIDCNHDNSVDSKDLIFEIFLGMQWGFL